MSPSKPALGGSYLETFAPGSFAKTITERGGRVPLLVQHDRERLPVGKAVEIHEEARGVVGTFQVARTSAGDDVLTLAQDGIATGFSVGFVPVNDEWAQGRSSVVRREVALHEVSMTATPIYADAVVEAVRSEDVLTAMEARAALDQYRPARALSLADATERLASAYSNLSRKDDDQ